MTYHSNNKKLGTAFEKRVCQELKERGWWVHFFAPDRTGAQPFDIIAVKGGNAIAVDAKTSSTHRFSIDRLEENQKLAFDRWLGCGNLMPQIAVEYEEKIVWLTYGELKKEKVVDLRRKIKDE